MYQRRLPGPSRSRRVLAAIVETTYSVPRSVCIRTPRCWILNANQRVEGSNGTVGEARRFYEMGRDVALALLGGGGGRRGGRIVEIRRRGRKSVTELGAAWNERRGRRKAHALGAMT